MSKTPLQKPLLIALYGYPGSGKSYVSRQLTSVIQVAHVNSDRIRAELFEEPRYDKQEDEIVDQLMNYMSHEFLNAGVSVVYDTNALRGNHRFALRELARRAHAEYLLVWLQIDADSAFARTQNRDRRTADDKFAAVHDEQTFTNVLGAMQNPSASENYLVISGKHSFPTQKNAVLNKLYQMGLIDGGTVQSSGVAKPGMVNLVPNPLAGRVDLSRRNINIR